MKTIKTVTALTLAALSFAACGNRTTKDIKDSDTISFEQTQIEQRIMAELDSIANLWNSTQQVQNMYNNGKLSLTNDELKAKPTYLLKAEEVSDLSLLSQKYRAFGIYAIDREIADLYNMDVTDLDAAMQKIAVEIGDPAIGAYSKVESNSDIKAFYVAEKEAGRVNLFWETVAAAVVENLYVMSQNSEKFLNVFDDKLATDLSYQINLLHISLDELATYDSNIKELDEMLAPLSQVNATSAAQLKEQVGKIKPQIAAIRAELLK